MTIGPTQIRQFCLCTASHATDHFSSRNPFCSCSHRGTPIPAPLRFELMATRQVPSFAGHPIPQQVQPTTLFTSTAFVSTTPPYTQQIHLQLFQFHRRLLRQSHRITVIQSIQLRGVQHGHTHHTRVQSQQKIPADPKSSHRPRRACIAMVEKTQQLPPIRTAHNTTQHPRIAATNSGSGLHPTITTQTQQHIQTPAPQKQAQPLPPAKTSGHKNRVCVNIWCKIRRKHLPQRLRSITQAPCFRDQRTAWQTLVNLSSNTRRRFDTTKQLMKHSTGPPAIYALHKMSHNMAPTHQRTARKSLATVLSKRKLPVPKGVAPLLTFPLGHTTFQTDLRSFLRECIKKHRDHTIPFHPPSTKVVFRRHPQIQQVLCNWRNTHRRWVPDQPPPCTCHRLHTAHYTHFFHGHIAAPLSTLLPDQHCLKFSSKSTPFPKVGQLRTQQIQAIQRWHKRNQIPAPPTDDPTLTNFINHQIQQHLTATHHHINIHITKQIQQQLPAGVIHCEDHHPISHAPPLTVHMETQQQLKDMLPNYKKHFGDWGKIPGAYVLPKRKKQFQKGRPVVAFVQPTAKALWQTLSDLLGALCRQACPHSFGDGDATSQLRQLTAMKLTSYTIRTWRASSHP